MTGSECNRLFTRAIKISRDTGVQLSIEVWVFNRESENLSGAKRRPDRTHEHFEVVLFPAPFWPKKPLIDPSGTLRLRSRTAATPPNSFVSCLVRIAGGGKVVIFIHAPIARASCALVRMCFAGDASLARGEASH